MSLSNFKHKSLNGDGPQTQQNVTKSLDFSSANDAR